MFNKYDIMLLNTIGAIHNHFNSQTSFIVCGIFEVTIGNEKNKSK